MSNISISKGLKMCERYVDHEAKEKNKVKICSFDSFCRIHIIYACKTANDVKCAG